MKPCPNCGAEAEPGFDTCWSCGTHLAAVPAEQPLESEPGDQSEGEGAESGQELFHQAAIRRTAPHVLLTTAQHVAGFRTTRTVDVVSAQCVFGMSHLREWFGRVTDIVGGRSVPMEKVFADARKICLAELQEQAAGLGANAVIAIKLDFGEMSGLGKSMPFLVATGTAVAVIPEEREG